MTTSDAIKIMADEAEERGEDANDTGGNVRAIVKDVGLGFDAWLCVCCELADRDAQRRGYDDQFQMALDA